MKAIELTELFAKDIVSFEVYQSDLKTKSAVERQLSIIGTEDTVVWAILKRHLPNLKVEVLILIDK